MLWTASKVTLNIILAFIVYIINDYNVEVSGTVLPASDDAVICEEPESGDRISYSESRILSYTTGKQTSAISVTYLKNVTNSSLTDFMLGYVSLVYSQQFTLNSVTYGKAQGPYSISQTSNVTLLHLVGDVNNSPRLFTSYENSDSAKPYLLALLVHQKDFCCFGDCTLITGSPSPPPPPLNTGVPSLSDNNLDPTSTFFPTSQDVVCRDANNRALMFYNTVEYTSILNSTSTTNNITNRTFANVAHITLNSTSLALLSSLSTDVRFLYSGGRFVSSSLFDMKMGKRTSTLLSSTDRVTTLLVSTKSERSSFILSYNTTIETFNVDQNDARIITKLKQPKLDGILLNDSTCCYGNCESATRLQRDVNEMIPDITLKNRQRCSSTKDLGFDYIEKPVLSDNINIAKSVGSNSSLYTFVSLQNFVQNVNSSKLRSGELSRIDLTFDKVFEIKEFYSTNENSGEKESLPCLKFDGIKNFLLSFHINGTQLSSKPTTAGFITKQVYSTIDSIQEHAQLLSIAVDGEICCDGLCPKVVNQDLLPVSGASLIAKVNEEEEEDVVEEVIESATPAVASTIGVSVVSSVATSMATTMTTSAVSSAAAGGAGVGGTGATSASSGSGSGGTAQLLMSVQLFNSLGLMQHLKFVKMTDRQKNMAEGLAWTNFQYNFFSESSDDDESLTTLQELIIPDQLSVNNTNLGLGRKLLNTTTNTNNNTGFGSASLALVSGKLSSGFVSIRDNRIAKKEESRCHDESGCFRRLANCMLVILLIISIVLFLHFGLMHMWRKLRRLSDVPYPPVLAFPNVEIIVLAFTFTAVTGRCAQLIGIGVGTEEEVSWRAIAVGSVVLLLYGGGIIYLMICVSVCVSKHKLGVSYEAEVGEVGMDADPLTRCCFPGKNRREGSWKNDREQDADAMEKTRRLLNFRLGFKATYAVLVERCKNLINNYSDSVDSRKKKNKKKKHKKNSHLVEMNKDTYHDHKKLTVEEIDGLERYGFVFSQFRAGVNQHYWTLMLIVRAIILMPAAFVSSTSWREQKSVNTAVIAIPFTILVFQLIFLVIMRPFRDRLQWISVIVISILETGTFAVQLLDINGSILNEIRAESLVFLLWASSMGVQIITKCYEVIFELIIAFRKIYYVFMTKLVFEKADFEMEAAQNSTFIVVKDGVAVGSAMSEYSTKAEKTKGGWWKAKSTKFGGNMKKVKIAPAPQRMNNL